MVNKNWKFDIVIPTYNERENVEPLFSKIYSLYKDRLNKVIFVDDNSNDNTYLLMEKFSQENNNVLCLKSNGEGKKNALKTAMAKASGDLIITTDADCSMGNSWLRSIAVFYEKEKPDDLCRPEGLYRLLQARKPPQKERNLVGRQSRRSLA